jgi:thiol-disulfide isomerase/thioredoxin
MMISRGTAGMLMALVIVGGIGYLESRKATPKTENTVKETLVQNPGETENTSPLSSSSSRMTIQALAEKNKQEGKQPAIEIADPTGFVNSNPFGLKDIVGKKVILLDFWTYSCINCIRTLPHLTEWYSKYKDQGLEIVGIHTPEFDFEKDYANVKAATEKYGITYPVVLDSNYGTWSAYGNRYWPHHYLIDLSGYIVEDHIGEGGYEETEATIQKLLAERKEILQTTSTIPTSIGGAGTAPSLVGSPETYFGASRNDYLGNGTKNKEGMQTFTIPKTIKANTLYLDGLWNLKGEYATNTKGGARIIYTYNARNVFFVGSAEKKVRIKVLRDGVPVATPGSDVKDGYVEIEGSRLYSLVEDQKEGTHTLELQIEDPGLDAYTFTFG